MDSIWADLNYDHEIFDTRLLKKHHYWGTPFYLGGAFIKIKSYFPPNIPRLDIMFDNIRLEWSPPLANFLRQVYELVFHYFSIIINTKKMRYLYIFRLCRCFCDYQFINTEVLSENSSKLDVNKSFFGIIYKLKASNINVFLIGDRKSKDYLFRTFISFTVYFNNVSFLVCIMIPMDEISFRNDLSKLSVSIVGVKMASIVPNDYYFTCIRSYDVKVNFDIKKILIK